MPWLLHPVRVNDDADTTNATRRLVTADEDAMESIEFTSSVVTADDGKILIAVFDGDTQPRALALLICSRETAQVLTENVSSALGSRST